MGQRFGWALLLAAVLVLSGACTASRPPTPTPTATATPTTPATQAGPAAEITATQTDPDQAVEITATPAPDQAAEGTATPAPDQAAGDENTATPTAQPPQDQATGDTAEDAAEQEAFPPTPEVDAEALAQEIQQWYQEHLGQRYEFLVRYWPKDGDPLWDEPVTDYWDKTPGAQERYILRMLQVVLARMADKMEAPWLDEAIWDLLRAKPGEAYLVFGSEFWIRVPHFGKVTALHPQPAIAVGVDESGELRVMYANDSAWEYIKSDNVADVAFDDYWGWNKRKTNIASIGVIDNGAFIAGWRINSHSPKQGANWGEWQVEAISFNNLLPQIKDLILHINR